MSLFRNPVNNARYTKSLFLEESYEDRSAVLYTLKDQDHDGYLSLYRKYLETSDPTELSFARKYFDGWEHWEMVANATWFKPFITRWRRELELQIRAKALANILEVSNNTSFKQYYEANKFLLSGAWKDSEPKGSSKAGRPSKDEIKRQAEVLFRLNKETEQDYDRMTKGFS